MTELKPMRFNLPTIRGLAKRGTNVKLLEWLTAYGDFFYKRGYNDAVVALRTNNDRIELESPSPESNECEGTNTDDSNSDGTGEEK